MKLKFLIKNMFFDFVLGLLLSFAIYFYLFSSNHSQISINGQNASFFVFFPLCFVIIMLFSFFSTFSFLRKNKVKEKAPTYLREMPRSYSPSMVSVLTNMKLEHKKDILADLLFLEQKGYIVIQNGETHPITVLEKEENFENGNKHLSSLLSYIKDKKQVTVEGLIKDAYSFYVSYQAKVYEDLIDLGLLKKSIPFSIKPFVMPFFVSILIFLYFFLFIDISSLFERFLVSIIVTLPIAFTIFQIVLYTFLLFLILNVIRGRIYVRTKKGKEDVALWFSYYDFLKDFSALDKRELSEKSLWGYYFAYGLSLGLSTKVIQKFSLKQEASMIR